MRINRPQILQSFLDNLFRISSKEYQNRVWIQGKGPEVHDFDEAVCDFFGDGDPILKNFKDFGLSEDQFNLLKKFRDEFKSFADNNDWPPEFIDTPEWTKITEMAKEVLTVFNYKKVLK